MKLSFSNNYAVGRYGEALIEKECLKRGWLVIDKNWHYGKMGEIDIVAADKKQLVFIEVKTRTSTQKGYPVEAITKKKREKLRRLANAWVRENKQQDNAFRIDSFSVLIQENGSEISHLRAVA